MKKKIISLLMAVMMLTSMSVTASAAGGADSISISNTGKATGNFESAITLNKYSPTSGFVSQNNLLNLFVLGSGDKITVTNNCDSSDGAYIYIYAEQYVKSSTDKIVSVTDDETFDDVDVNFKDKYYNGGNYKVLRKTNGVWGWTDSSYVLSSALSMSGDVLYSGESATFTLPTSTDPSICKVYAEIYYPITGTAYYKYNILTTDSSVGGTSVEIGATWENPFTDVKPTDYFYDPVGWAVTKGITVGTSNTTFSPHATCTHAQILTFLWRANGSPEPTVACPYSNVKTTDYFYKAVAWAYQNGMVSGSTFNPHDPCTRSQTMVYLWKLAGKPTASACGFVDVPSTADYYDAVNWGVYKGITSGTSATTFTPDSTCTRAQIVTFLWRAFA